VNPLEAVNSVLSSAQIVVDIGFTVIGFSSTSAVIVAVTEAPQTSFAVTWNVASLDTSAVGEAIAGFDIVALPLKTLQV
jgi:hypothetical protein